MKILKVTLLFLLALGTYIPADAQWMLINQDGGTPDPTAALELRDTTKGFLPPRLTTTQMNAISGPAAGLLIYNTDSSCYCSYDGTKWDNVANSATDTTANIPVGTIIAFGGDTNNIPAGFLLCDGASLAQSAYSELFAAIGAAWGGDAANFNLPDLRGRFLRGVANGSTNDPDRASRIASSTGGNTGDKVGAVQGDAFQSHGHLSTLSNSSGDAAGGTARNTIATTGGGIVNDRVLNPTTLGSFGTPRVSTETRPINANVNYIICYSSSIPTTSSGSTAFQGTVSASNLPASAFEDSTRITDAAGNTKIEINGSNNTIFSNGGSESARFTSSGFLGLNNNNPQAVLDVGGTAIIDSLRIYNAYSFPGYDGTNGQVLQTDGSGEVTWQPAPSSPWTVSGSNVYRSSGRVGIGTSNPRTTLHLHTAASVGHYVEITNGTSLSRGLQLGINNAGIAYILQKENFDLKIRTNDIDRITVQAGGNVGIGTVTPTVELDVNGDAKISGKTTTGTFQLTSGSSLNGKVLTSDGSGNGTWQPAPSGADGDGIYDGSGNLTSNTTVTMAAHQMVYNLTGAGDFFIRDNGTNVFRVNDNGDVEIDQGSLFVDADVNNVGIGTSSPQVPLHLTGGNDASLNATNGYMVIGNTNSNNLVFDNNEILARDNGATSFLALNANGGAISMHAGINDVNRWGVFLDDGNFILGDTLTANRTKLRVAGKVLADTLAVLNGVQFPLDKGTNGQVLTSNGSGLATWQPVPSSADNLGNHTATQRIQLNGNKISNDGGNEGLSIADNGEVTATPATQGAGNKAMSTNGDFFTNGQGTGIYFSTYDIGIDGNDGNSGALRLKTGSGTPRLTISNTGAASFSSTLAVSGTTTLNNDVYVTGSDDYVGIGTSSPTSQLTIFGDSSSAFTLKSTDNTKNHGIAFQNSGNAYSWVIRRENSSTANNPDFVIAGGDVNSDITSLDERFRITNDGNVGIGTANPTADLTIASTSTAAVRLNTYGSTLNEASILYLTKARGTESSPTAVVNGDNIARINAVGYDGSTYQSAARIRMSVDGTPGTNDMPGRIQFFTTADGSATNTERMRITNSGNIGIGTTAPATNLHVTGTAPANAATGQLQIDESGGNSLMLGRTATYGYAQTQNSEPFVINPLSNNVGIGTTAPTSVLHVDGKTTIDQSATSGIGIQVRRSDDLSNVFRVFTGTGNNGNIAIHNASNTTTVKIASGTDDSYFNTTGNFGLGTNSPSSRLHVSSTSSGLATFENTGGHSYTNQVASTNNKAYTLYKEGTNTWGSVGMEGSDNSFRIYHGTTSGNPVFMAKTDLLVGVGTTNPQAQFHVSGGDILVDNTKALDGELTSGAAVNLIRVSSANHVQIGDNAVNDVRINVGSTLNALVVEDGGQVGIGTVNPSYDLDVVGNINASLTVRAAGVALVSDRRYKTNILPLEGALASLKLLSGVYHNWDTINFPKEQFPKGKAIGVIAQDMQKIYPELVYENNDGYLAVDYAKFSTVLLEAIKEQQKQIELLQVSNAAKQDENGELKSELNGYEKRLKRLEFLIEQNQSNATEVGRN